MPFAARAMHTIQAQARADIATGSFLGRLIAGTSTRTEVRLFCQEQFHYVNALSRHIAALYANVDSPTTRRALLHLIDAVEPFDRPSLAQHLLATCAAFGGDSEVIRASLPAPATQLATTTVHDLCATNTICGLAALNLMVQRDAHIARIQIQALSEQFRLGEGSATKYFELRDYEGSEQAQMLSALLDASISTPDDVDMAIDASTRVSIALAMVYDEFDPAAAAQHAAAASTQVTPAPRLSA